ncbi:MAG: hypothetical protein NUW22_08725 [Acidobacteria bacterium]|nr:hypothetical protein [Acidobacteriota bacterium]
MTRAILGVFVCVLLPVAAAAQPARHAVIIQGASGEPMFAEQHRGWLDAMAATLRARFTLGPAELTVMAEQAREGEQRATAENVRATFTKLAASLQSTDLLFVMLIGHGTADAASAKFNLVGPDLSVEDWKAVLAPVKARLVFVNSSSASFPFAAGLTGDRRIIITSTSTAAQRYSTMFADAFVQALNASAADLDKDGRLSMWEAFFYASRIVKQYYEQKGLLATERPLLEDNGDGKGREAMSATGEDGTLSTMTYLDAVTGARAADPALQMLLQKQELLTDQVDELKRKKAAMPAAEYDAAWEKLMIELATVGAQIRAKGGDQAF